MRIISVITALALTLSGSLSAQKPTKLTDDPIYKDGISALADHLPAIASKKFATLLKSNTNDKDKLALLFLLTESQIRDIKPNKALTTLTNPLISNHPDAVFWKGQALATAGRYNEAIQTLELVSPKSQHYNLSQIKIANLAAAINDIDKALSILSRLVKDSKKISPQTYLSLANLYISKEDPKNAAKMLEKIVDPDELTSKVKQVIQAQVDILQKTYPQAIKSLDLLLNSSEKLDRRTLSYATLYLADALHLNGQTQEATDTLVSYLDTNMSSPLLGAMFTRLDKWIPSNTAITNDTIKKLISWAGRDKLEPNDINNKTDDERSDFKAFAHYYYARHLANQTEEASKTKAIFEFSLLIHRYPTHILANTSLTDTASTQLALERIEPAKQTLERIQKLSTPIAPIAKQQAAFLLGKINLDQKNYQAAAVAFQAVVDTAEDELQTASIINAASAYLAAADVKGYQQLQQKIDAPLIQNNLLLEYALWLVNENKLNARSILLDFTIKYPSHPRINEAKLALALHCLRISPSDPYLCQTTILKINTENLPPDQQADHSYLLYRNSTAHKDHATAADTARQFIEAFPEHPRKVEFILLQGQALYHNGQHNDARRILLNLVKTYPEHSLRHYAEYYAAMSAKLEGTPQSEDEAILLFSKVVAEKSNLTTEALLQLSQLYIDKNQPQEAVNALKPVFDAQPKGKKSLNIGVILASAYHAQGNSQPEHFRSALNIYDSLIVQNQNNIQALNQLKYNKALTLQHMGNNDAALDVYYSVINIDTKVTPITEWKWYYKCGFTAIAMLEDMKNPTGAIGIAKKLSKSNGNRAADAAKRARELEMEYMIWQH